MKQAARQSLLKPEIAGKPDFTVGFKALNWFIFVLFGIFRGSLSLALKLASSAGGGLDPAFILVARAPPPVVLFGLLVLIRACIYPEIGARVKSNFKSWRVHLKMIYLGFSQGLPFIFLTYASVALSPSIVTILMSATPLLTQLAAMLPFKLFDTVRKPMSVIKGVGFLVGIGGIVLAIMSNFEGGNLANWEGYVLALIGVTIWGVGTAIWGAIKGKDTDYLVAALGQNFWAGVISLVISAGLEYKNRHWQYDWRSPVLWGALVWVSLGSGFGSALMQHWLYQSPYMGEVKSAGVLYVSPIVAMIEVNIYYHAFSQMAWWQILCEVGGFVLVVAGLLMVNARKKKPAKVDMRDSKRYSEKKPLLNGSANGTTDSTDDSDSDLSDYDEEPDDPYGHRAAEYDQHHADQRPRSTSVKDTLIDIVRGTL